MFKLKYTNSNNESIEFYTDPYKLVSVEGLGDVEIDNIISKSYNQDGASIKRSSLQPRYITITIKITGINYNEVERNRKKLYSIFNHKLKLGTLEYIGSDNKEIKCMVESMPYFPDGDGNRSNYYQIAQIDLIAPNPYWQDTIELREDISTLVGNFSFPWEIPTEGYEVAIRTISYVTNIYNSGDVETPIRASLTAIGTVVNPIVTNLATGEYIMVKRELSKGDELEIDTQYGNKRVEIIRSNGDRENAFNYIDYKSTFFSVDSGDTEIEYGAEIGDNNLDVYIYYTPRYLGV